jgi:hypothetical protein
MLPNAAICLLVLQCWNLLLTRYLQPWLAQQQPDFPS